MNTAMNKYEILKTKIAQAIENQNLGNFVVKVIDSIRREISVLDRVYAPQVIPGLTGTPLIQRDPQNPQRFFTFMQVKANLGPAYFIDVGGPVPIQTTNQRFVPVYNAPPIKISWEKPIEMIQLLEYNIFEDIKEAIIERVGDMKDDTFFKAIRKIITVDGSIANTGRPEIARYHDANYYLATNPGIDRVVIDAFRKPKNEVVLEGSTKVLHVGLKDLMADMVSKTQNLRVGAGVWLFPRQAYNLIGTWDFMDAGMQAPFFFAYGSYAAALQTEVMFGLRFEVTTKTVNYLEGEAGEVQGPININVLGAPKAGDLDTGTSDPDEVVPSASFLYLMPDEEFGALHLEVQPIIQETRHVIPQMPTYRLDYIQYWFLGIGISRAYLGAPIYYTP